MIPSPSIIKKQPTSRMCFVCGESNAAGVHVRFYELEDGSVQSRFTGAEYHQGYPGRMHGGVITAILDETIGRAGMIRYGEDIRGVTVEINVRFLRPVPLGVELTATGRVTEDHRRLFMGAGELLLPDGTIAAEAAGKFFKLQMSKEFFDPEREDWRVRPD